MFLNLRMRLGCMIAGFGIRLLPVEWRTHKSLGNLILIGRIDTGIEDSE